MGTLISGSRLWPGFAAAALLLAACSDSTSPGNGSGNLTPATALDAGASALDEAETSMEAITPEGALDPASAFSRSAFSGQLSAPPQVLCATISGSSDTDADGVRDSVVFTYALPACRFSNFNGGTLELTGQVAMIDPTATIADFAYRAELRDFTRKLTSSDPEQSYTAVRNGSRTVTGNAAGLSLSNQIVTVRSFTSRPSATISHNLLVSFTPNAGTTLTRARPLPSGTFVVNGTLTFARGEESRTFTVTTVTPLTFDAGCTGHPKITAGETRATLASGAYIKTVWTGCGVRPTRTYVPAQSS